MFHTFLPRCFSTLSAVIYLTFVNCHLTKIYKFQFHWLNGLVANHQINSVTNTCNGIVTFNCACVTRINWCRRCRPSVDIVLVIKADIIIMILEISAVDLNNIVQVRQIQSILINYIHTWLRSFSIGCYTDGKFWCIFMLPTCSNLTKICENTPKSNILKFDRLHWYTARRCNFQVGLLFT